MEQNYLNNSNTSFSENVTIPIWSFCLSTFILGVTFFIGIPLNGTTILIFVRRKKLRHLVNWLLLLDSVSHIFVGVIAIPVHFGTVLKEEIFLSYDDVNQWKLLQQVVGNFGNLFFIFITASIAILRYRRVCWKKKDDFCVLNATKWSLWSMCIGIGLTIAQSWTAFHLTRIRHTQTKFKEFDIYLIQRELDKFESLAYGMYGVEMGLCTYAVFVVVFCYVRVSQRVKATKYDSTRYTRTRKKSRNLHSRATLHSCIQILLTLCTLIPHLLDETLNIIYVGKKPQFFKIVNLISTTTNYTLLVFGSPLAYIASCHKFREQFCHFYFKEVETSIHFFRKFSGSKGSLPSLPVTGIWPNKCIHTNTVNTETPHHLKIKKSTTIFDDKRKMYPGSKNFFVVTKTTSHIISALTFQPYGENVHVKSTEANQSIGIPSNSCSENSNSYYGSLVSSTDGQLFIPYKSIPCDSLSDLTKNMV